MKEEKKIQVESNYSRFMFIKGNRPIVKNKVTNLVKSYEGGLNLFPFCPVLINSENYVIDGQHRLMACKELKLPVYFMVVPDVSLVQIATLNAIQSKWSQADFFNCYIENGIKDYTALDFFKSKYSIPLNIAAGLLMTGKAHAGGSFADTFKNGEFRVLHQVKAEKIMRAVMDYQDVISDEKILRTRSFIEAIQFLLESNMYVHASVFGKLKENKSKIQYKSSRKEYIFHIEELFNKGNQNRKFIYQKPQTLKGE